MAIKIYSPCLFGEVRRHTFFLVDQDIFIVFEQYLMSIVNVIIAVIVQEFNVYIVCLKEL